MANLVRRQQLSGATVELIGKVEQQAGHIVCVLVAVHNAGRNHHADRAMRSDAFLLKDAIGRRGGAVVPQIQLEMGRAEKAEIIRLPTMFMRARTGARPVGSATGNPWPGSPRAASHEPKQFAQPAAFINLLVKKANDHIVDDSERKIGAGMNRTPFQFGRYGSFVKECMVSDEAGKMPEMFAV